MNALRLASCALLSAVCIGMSLATPPPLPHSTRAGGAIVFNRDIRPILSDNCFACHGPDKNKRQANLRLDGPNRAVVPGDILASALVQEVRSGAMPPADYHKKLTAAQKQLLMRWIGEGAKYQKHWAYEMPVKPAIPAGKNAIDFLVQKRLAERGLKPSPTADRRTLIRRLSFDLLGLPPSPQEVAAFVSDKAPDAYAKLVERLLASPHYGERMAQSWLDVTRFADTIGYHSDTPRNIWPYRDYVISAFNTNKRFDRFTREQLAGDLLPDANQETRVGSAFNRLLLTTEEGGAQAKDYEARYLTDRVRAVGTVWLGQTTGCANCHDHKFDPITQKDFFRLGAYFADIEEGIIAAREPGMLVPTPEQARELASREARVTELQRRYEAIWRPLKPVKSVALGGTVLTVQPDNAVLASGPNPDKNTYTLELAASGTLTGVRLEVLPDPSLPARGPGRAGNGNFVLSELVAERLKPGAEPQKLTFSKAQASIEQASFAEAHPDKRWSAASALTPDSFGWAILPDAGKPHELVATLAEPLTLTDGETLRITLVQNHGTNHNLGKFRLTALTGTEVPETLKKDLADARKAKSDYEAGIGRCLVTVQNTKPRTVRILPRGDFLNETGEVVTAAIPAFLTSPPQPSSPGRSSLTGKGGGPRLDSPFPSDEGAPGRGVGERLSLGQSRLELANWLVSRENPLTARTVVNRFWKQFFGNGISKVLEDLGAQGEPPTNPALLDWLACEFVDSGWDVKHLVRLMVNSNTYKQTSTASKALLAADPYNREYARQSRFRLEAEEVRDNALAISGLLSLKLGGPSVKPYQPERYWENLNFPVRDWTADKGESQYRRGLYTWWQRSFLHPSLLAFDAPSREECTAERNRSNIPQQALVLLNDPTYVEAARAFGVGILTQASGTPEQKLTWAFQQALQRNPTASEQKTLLAVYSQQLAGYKADQAASDALLKTGYAPLPTNLDKPELAAWTHVARVLLNLHETITRP
ncbi:PSD1 and planctomycete cytochrome C domain-containing protein [Armatimonas rosea]|uniref:Cytochrome c553 n=1 Tax=Armatimonas rosea TaxID=685828 RepID=A0A7W9SPY4_ARMRO|nr:PSD1 and planctomycete cytochrome C domain-containing protein [Armatimonas rosea]MBB6050003.1 cytochrome c553 [Armatimonas rosea]